MKLTKSEIPARNKQPELNYGAMAHTIFISYRREDSGWSTQALYTALCGQFGVNRVFMDVDDIQGGEDFTIRIKTALWRCDVLIAVIGSKWLSASNAGKRRLDNPDDYVRLEIRTALEREIRVIPVLVDGASIPDAEDLPDELTPLVRRNAIPLDHTTFQADIRGLTKTLNGNLNISEHVSEHPIDSKKSLKGAWIGAGGTVIAALIGGAFLFFANQRSDQPDPAVGEAIEALAVQLKTKDYLQLQQKEEQIAQIGNPLYQSASQAKERCKGSDGAVAIRAFAISLATPDLLAGYIRKNAAAFSGKNRAMGCLSSLLAKAEVIAEDPTQIDPSTTALVLSAGPTINDTIRGISEGRVDVANLDIVTLLDGNTKSSTILLAETQALIYKWEQQNELVSNIKKALHDMAMTPIRNIR